jgi:hypothetical protein
MSLNNNIILGTSRNYPHCAWNYTLSVLVLVTNLELLETIQNSVLKSHMLIFLTYKRHNGKDTKLNNLKHNKNVKTCNRNITLGISLIN